MRSDLGQEIRDLFDEVAPPVDARRIAESFDRRESARRTWHVGIVAAVAAFVVGGLALLISRQMAVNPDDESVVATSTTVPNPEVSAAGWTLVPDPTGAFAADPFVESVAHPDGSTLTGGSQISVLALVDSPEGVVAVGQEQFGLRSMAAVWTSNDGGFTWERVPHDAAVFGGVDHELGDTVPSGLSMTAVTYGQGRFVAVGTDTSVGMDPVAWYSDDGRSWTRVSVEEGPHPGVEYTTVSGVVAGGPGFVAVGADSVSDGYSTRHSALLWTSQDGAVWQTSSDAIPGGTSAAVADVAIVDGSIIAVGLTFDPQTAAAWVSEDGVTWQVASVVDTTETTTPIADMRHVAATPGGAIAIGLASSRSGSAVSGAIDTDIALWITSDGMTWSRVLSPDSNDEMIRLPGPVASGPGGILGLISLTAEVLDFRESGSVMWTSTDGVDWEEKPITLIGKISDLVVIDGRYIAAGSAPRVGVEWETPDDVTWDGAIWIHG